MNVKVDRNFNRFQNDVAALTDDELVKIMKQFSHIEKLTWTMVQAQTSRTQGESGGLNWKKLDGQKTSLGDQVHSLRMSKTVRARAFRSAEYMVFLSLHPKHGAEYDEPGLEEVEGLPVKIAAGS